MLLLLVFALRDGTFVADVDVVPPEPLLLLLLFATGSLKSAYRKNNRVN